MTDKQYNQPPDPQSYPPSYEEDEISLIDLLRVVWKWKWLIIAGTLICAIAAAVISLQLPKIYEVSTMIEPGIAGVKNDGSFLYIDSVANISGKINGGIYNRKVEKALQLDPLKTRVEFKSAVVKKTSLINISSQWEEGNTDLGVKAFRQIMDLISGDYSRIVEQRKGDYDKQIFMKQNDINKLGAQRTSLKETLANIKQRIAKLKKEVLNVKNNTEDLMKQRDILLKKDKIGVEMPLLLYSTTVQQNISYFNEINDQIYEFEEKKEEAQWKNKNLEEDINAIEAEITAFNASKGLISNIKVIQEPEVSLYPIKPKKKQIVLLAGFASLFMFTFLAFFLEYIRNVSKEE